MHLMWNIKSQKARYLIKTYVFILKEIVDDIPYLFIRK